MDGGFRHCNIEKCNSKDVQMKDLTNLSVSTRIERTEKICSNCNLFGMPVFYLASCECGTFARGPPSKLTAKCGATAFFLLVQIILLVYTEDRPHTNVSRKGGLRDFCAAHRTFFCCHMAFQAASETLQTRRMKMTITMLTASSSASSTSVAVATSAAASADSLWTKRKKHDRNAQMAATRARLGFPSTLRQTQARGRGSSLRVLFMMCVHARL